MLTTTESRPKPAESAINPRISALPVIAICAVAVGAVVSFEHASKAIVSARRNPSTTVPLLIRYLKTPAFLQAFEVPDLPDPPISIQILPQMLLESPNDLV